MPFSKYLRGLSPSEKEKNRRTTDIELKKGGLIDTAAIDAINTKKYGGKFAEYFGKISPEERIELSKRIRRMRER